MTKKIHLWKQHNLNSKRHSGSSSVQQWEQQGGTPVCELWDSLVRQNHNNKPVWKCVCMCVSTVSSAWGMLPMKASQGGAHISCSCTAGHCRLTLSLDWEKVGLPPPCLPTVGWHGCSFSLCCPTIRFPKQGRGPGQNKKQEMMGEKWENRISLRNECKCCVHGNTDSCLENWRHPYSAQNTELIKLCQYGDFFLIIAGTEIWGNANTTLVNVKLKESYTCVNYSAPGWEYHILGVKNSLPSRSLYKASVDVFST